jgi:glycine dehydrogenase
MQTDSFVLRHLGPSRKEVSDMLKTIGVESLQELVTNTVPDDILLNKELDLPEALSENEFAEHIQKLGSKNKLFKSYIGMGYHPTTLPAVIQRNIFENPS